MPAYVITDIHIHDPEGYKDYVELMPPTLELYGGRFLARGGASELLEGELQPNRIVVLEFPNTAQAKKWLASPEYAPAKAIRHRCSTARMIVTEGLIA